MILATLHSFVNIFAGGRSEIKVFLFIIYLALLILLYFLFKHRSFAPLKWKWFGFVLLAAYLYGLLLHIFYTLSNNLLLADFFITGNNGEISSSTIWHTHIGKGAIGQIFSFFGKTNLATMDGGGAYIGLIPGPVFLFGSILIIALVLQAVIYFIASFKPLMAGKNKRQKIFLVLGYAIVSFSLIKTSLDGGIFNPGFVLALIFVWLFILRNKKRLAAKYYYSLLVAGIIFISGSLYMDFSRPGSGLGIGYMAALLLLYSALLYGSEEKIRPYLLTSFLTLFLLGWWTASARDRDIYAYSGIMLPEGQEIYTYDGKSHEVKISKIEQPISVMGLAKQMNKNITYLPVAVPGVTCMAKGPVQELYMTLVSPHPVGKDLSSSPHIKIVNEGERKPGRNSHTKLHLYFDPCLPEILSVINGELIKSGISTYLLVNPSHATRDY